MSISILAQEIFTMQAFCAVIIWTVLGVSTKCSEAIGFLSPVSIKCEDNLQKPGVHTHPLPLGARLVVSPPASSMTAATPRLPHTPQAQHSAAHCGAAGFPLGPEGKLQALNAGRH